MSGDVDLSEEPRRWLATKGVETAPPRRMEETSFEQLWLRLGKQYLFLHQGSCEHAIVFTRCSLLSASAVLSSSLAVRDRANSSVVGEGQTCFGQTPLDRGCASVDMY